MERKKETMAKMSLNKSIKKLENMDLYNYIFSS